MAAGTELPDLEKRAAEAERRAAEMEHRYDRLTLAVRDNRDLEERVAALEAAVAMFSRKLLQSGDISVNDVRATLGLPPFREPWADSPGYSSASHPGGIPGAA